MNTLNERRIEDVAESKSYILMFKMAATYNDGLATRFCNKHYLLYVDC